jgi:Ca2+-transporting ATPase
VARELDLFGTGPETVVEGRDLATGDLGPDGARLADVPVFARVEPEQKLRLIRLFRDRGDVVAMLGDGVNDAPALRQADIGVAMGLRGTQVAREAADLVLEDDALASVVGAVEQGRIILANLRRFVAYLLSCNATEIVLVGGAAALGAPLPLLPLQILYLNLVTDVFPALALGFGEGDAAVMARGPSAPGTPLLARRHWLRIGGYAATLAGAVLTAMLVARLGLGWSERRAGTVAFLGLALGQLGHVFDMRGRGSRPLSNDVVRNPWVWGAIALCLALLAAAVHLPGLAPLLGTVAPGAAGWGLAALAALAPLGIAQVDLALGGRRLAAAVSARPAPER